MLTSIARAATRRSASTAFTWSPRLSLSKINAAPAPQLVQLVCAPSLAVRGYAAVPASNQRREKRHAAAPKKSISGTSKKTRKAPKSQQEKKPAAKLGRPSQPDSAKSSAAKLLREKKALKETALLKEDTEPKPLNASAWTLFIADKWTSKGGIEEGAAEMKSLASAWSNLSSHETEQYQAKANENKLINAANYKAWVERHTVLEIANANKARRTLKTKFNFPKNKQSTHKAIKDERQPKRLITPYAYYTKARFSDGNHTGRVTEHVSAISKEWKAMTDAQKQPYFDLAKADGQRYEKERAAAGLSD